MPLELASRRDPWLRLALALWAVAVLVLVARAAWQPRKRSLYPTYAAAAADWVAGLDPYRPGRAADLDLYRYSPVASVLLLPCRLLPERLGNVAWRVLGAGSLLAAVAWWLRDGVPCPLSARRRGLFYLALMPLCLTSLNNGQANTLVIALLLAAVTAAARRYWWLTAVFVALATALKVYPLAVGLLLAAAYPRHLAPRLLLALAALATLPFLFQDSAFVLDQYRSWYRLVALDDRSRWDPALCYRDLWLLIRVLGLPIGRGVYCAIQLSLAGACCLVCLAGRLLGWGGRELATTAFLLGVGWITLCGPATEAATFILLAPALAWVLVEPRRLWPASLPLAVGAALLFAVTVLAGLFPNASRVHALGFHPLATLLYLSAALGGAVRALQTVPPLAAARGRRPVNHPVPVGGFARLVRAGLSRTPDHGPRTPEENGLNTETADDCVRP